MEYFNLFLSILSSISFGTIIVTILNYYLKKKESLTSLDKQIFIFYRYIYFSAVRDGLGNLVPTDIASRFFHNLAQEITKDANTSLLLSDEVKIALNNFINNSSTKKLRILTQRIEKEFIHLKKKNGYHCSSWWEKFVFFLNFCLIIVSSILLVFSILYMIIYIYKQGMNLDELLLAYLVSTYSFVCLIFSLIYYQKNKYFV